MLNPRDPDFLIKTALALLFFGAGLFTAFLLGKVYTLTCARVEDADRCVLRVNWMGLAQLEETRIEELSGARVEETCDSDSNDCTYRVLLLTARDALPLDPAYTDGKIDKQAIVDQINAFAKDRSIRDLEANSGGGFWLLFPLVFLGAGVGMAAQPLRQAFRALLKREK